MHRLFWKLFLSFWVALLLFATGVLIAASLYLDRAREAREGGQGQPVSEQLREEAQAAVDGGGTGRLVRWLQRYDDENLVPLLMLDHDGHDLLQREVPMRLQARLLRYTGGANLSALTRRRPVHLPDGNEYWPMLDAQGVSLKRMLSRPRIIAAELLIATLVGGLVCLLLARYITAPIERLQGAAQAYGLGDFSMRVRPRLGRRRDEIAKLASAMDAMAERIENLLKAQRMLLSDVSHELRSPLARVQAALGLARQRQGQGAAAELDRIEREAERLNDLIGDILAFSRLDSGARQLQRTEVRLDQLIATVVDEICLDGEAQRDAVTFVNEVGEVSCMADLALLRSALENVLANALRYAGGAAGIAVRLQCREEMLAICVDDCGPGIPEELLERIFEPFVRVDASRSSKKGGVGLGLAIARRAIEAQGGWIRASNRQGGGLQVCMTLPAAPPVEVRAVTML